MERTRTVTWEDTLSTQMAARGLNGLEVLEAIRDGKLPPPPLAVLLRPDLKKAGEAAS